MIEKNADQFKIRLDDDYEEHTFTAKEDVNEKNEVQESAPSRNSSLVIILLMCLLGILLAFGYMDTRKRISSIQTTGSTQVNNLSQDVGTKLSNFTDQSAALEKLTKTEIATIKKEMDELTRSLDKNKTYLKQSEESGKKTLETSISSINKKISALEKKMETAVSEISTLDSQIKRELVKISDIVDRIEKELSSVKSDISLLNKKSVEQEKINLAVEIQQKRINQDLEKIQKYVENRLTQMQKNIQSVQNTTNPSPTPTTTPAGKPSPKQPATSTGDIIEQDISE